MIKLRTLIILLFSCFALIACSSPSSDSKKIGIIVPIEHKALDEIVSGFKDTLTLPVSANRVTFKVANAQGDINLQRAIIQQMKDEHYSLIVPIGTGATEMTAAMIQTQPILSLASTFSEEARRARKFCNIAVVNDEIPAQSLINFIHAIYPATTHWVLIHSGEDKIFPEVSAAVETGKANGLVIKPIMVTALNELYSAANNISPDTQGILILKDNLIASGISTLVIAAEKRKIPLVTSDQGSVQSGAAFGLGVHERDIGVEGAKLAEAILAGKSPCDIPIAKMGHLTIFVNESSLDKENQTNTLNILRAYAKDKQYTVEITSADSGE